MEGVCRGNGTKGSKEGSIIVIGDEIRRLGEQGVQVDKEQYELVAVHGQCLARYSIKIQFSDTLSNFPIINLDSVIKKRIYP